MYSRGVCKTIEHVLILSGNFNRRNVATQYNCQHDRSFKGSITSKHAHAQCVRYFEKLNVVNQSF